MALEAEFSIDGNAWMYLYLFSLDASSIANFTAFAAIPFP
ncbi:hypothetical protein SD77_0011 [Bacillus badius]|uniref:Uncharacterized protein n=1 Tax=Bacillus badius TaxID=1455 RepID=A0ABR5B0X4_BACBA|nr:hypothetical protein SD77_0011 [Bacillus badius]